MNFAVPVNQSNFKPDLPKLRVDYSHRLVKEKYCSSLPDGPHIFSAKSATDVGTPLENCLQMSYRGNATSRQFEAYEKDEAYKDKYCPKINLYLLLN